MFRAMIIVAAVSAGAWTAGSQATSLRNSCCAPGADCCFPGSDCCVPGAACCAEAAPVAVKSCCSPTADCCLSGEACCTSFVSATLDEKPAPAKEVKLAGTLVCGSCKLNESKKCANVLQVKEKDKTINYWLIDKGADEPFHEKICGGEELKGVTVTGVVSEKDGKKWVKTSKVDVK
jgi:hypothetical protein